MCIRDSGRSPDRSLQLDFVKSESLVIANQHCRGEYTQAKHTQHSLLFKEVIQPQIPLRPPCYDFTPVAGHTVVSALPKVRLPTSGATNFHGVTGGVYKTRERIHRDNADSRLLAIPTSRSRVAACNPN